MIWQDLALSITNIIVGYALIPQVYHGFKNKVGAMTLQTAIISTIGIFMFAAIFATMNLLLSAAISTFNGIMWSLLLIQKLVYR